MQASEHEQVETQLLAFVRKLERNYYDWRVVHLHLSALKPRNRRDYQLRIAAREFDGLVRKFKSELFQISNGDIFFIWHGGTYRRRRSGGPAPALPVQRRPARQCQRHGAGRQLRAARPL